MLGVHAAWGIAHRSNGRRSWFRQESSMEKGHSLLRSIPSFNEQPNWFPCVVKWTATVPRHHSVGSEHPSSSQVISPGRPRALSPSAILFFFLHSSLNIIRFEYEIGSGNCWFLLIILLINVLCYLMIDTHSSLVSSLVVHRLWFWSRYGRRQPDTVDCILLSPGWTSYLYSGIINTMSIRYAKGLAVLSTQFQWREDVKT